MKQTPQSKPRGEERQCRTRTRLSFETPTDPKKAQHFVSTPETTAMTPSTPLSEYSQRSMSDEGYLGEREAIRIKTLFREELHRQDEFHKSESMKVRSPSSRKSRRHSSVVRRSSKSSRSRSSKPSGPFEFNLTPATSSSTDASDDSSPDRFSARLKRFDSLSSSGEDKKKIRLSHQNFILLLFAVVVLLSLGVIFWSNRTMNDEFLQQYERAIRHHQRHHKGPMEAGLRGKLVKMAGVREYAELQQFRDPLQQAFDVSSEKDKATSQSRRFEKAPLGEHDDSYRRHRDPLSFNPRPPIHVDLGNLSFDPQDRALYRMKKTKKKPVQRRVVYFGKKPSSMVHRTVQLYPAEYTDNTQYYGAFSSDDERLSHMEIRQPLDDGECVPMKEWQTTYHPSCNAMHELGMEYMGESDTGDNFNLFGTKGYWRNAWKVGSIGGLNSRETIVLKTLKFQHNFEDAHFEHDRVDAVAMERLTSSPHVVNIFGFCGHSVLTEFADGPRVGELADKNKRIPLARLRIARDIADGLADVHGIDGDGLATFVHLDINPANVVSIGGTLKLNDFNIGILRRWNTTSNTQCGFPAQYPNPQWRSPEEARNEQNLTEKVDIFSMGHIFFRLICGHEPWNKLEEGGKPSNKEINAKVRQGVLPRIPEEILTTTDTEVAAIRDVMLSCYALDPAKRPSARTIATRLQKALDSLESQNQAAL